VKVILVHCQYQQPGGEDVVFEQERQMLESAGHEVVLYRRTNYEVDAFPGAKRLVLLQKAVWNGDTRDDFAELLRKEKPDLVHVHNTWIMISPSIYWACREAGVPVVQTLHNYRLLCPVGTFFRDGKVCEECLDHSLWRGLRNRCYRDSRAETAAVGLMLAVHRTMHTWERQVTSFIVLTEFAKSKFLRGGLPAEKIFVKGNFVDPDPGPRTGDGEYAIFAGRLSPERRISTVLSAWTRLKSRVPLKIVGGGEQRDQLQLKALKDKLDMVEFTGLLPHDQAIAAIGKARFLIFSSEWYETFGLTLIEAFACGVPVICSRMGAMQEIVEDHRTGLHFTPGDSQDLAEKVEWAWNHPDEMRAMGLAARQEYEDKYTAERNYPRLMEIYQQAIAVHQSESAASAPSASRAAAAAASSAATKLLASSTGVSHLNGNGNGNGTSHGAPALMKTDESSGRLRVVMAHNYYQIPGGEDETLRRESELLRLAGHDVKQFIRRNSEIKRTNFIAKASLAARTIWAGNSHEALLAFLRQEQPDLVHFHNTFPLLSPSVYYACREAGVPVVQTLHNPRLFCPGGYLERDHRICEDCKGKKVPWPSVVHACYRNSHIQTAVAAAMLSVHWQLKTWEKMITVYIVSTPFYRRKFIEAGFPEDRLMLKPHFVEDPGVVRRPGTYVAFVGRLAQEKGVPTLIGAWEKMRNIPLKIRGEGPLLPAVQELAQKSGGMVEILPRLDRRGLNHLMGGARFLVWPSEGYYETFGYVAVEAFACGLPVIASRVGVAEEIVRDQVTGLHFNPADPDDMAAKVEWAWAHPKEMNEMGRAARAEYEAKYTPERNYPMLMNVYRRALSLSKSPAPPVPEETFA
jgi:glycosyltransferase involved in cell wall biosynthesis